MLIYHVGCVVSMILGNGRLMMYGPLITGSGVLMVEVMISLTSPRLIDHATVDVDDAGAIRRIRAIDGEFGKLRRSGKRAADDVGRSLSNGFGLGQAKLRELGSQMQQFGGQAQRVGIVATAALAGVVAIAVSQEQAFTGVRKTVEATEAQFRGLREEIRTLSETIPTSFNQLSKIAEIGGQLGILQQDLGKFTETIARLGESTNLIGEEGAKALARFSNITGTAQRDVDRLGATFVALGNTTATTEAEIATMALRLGSAGTVAGISAQEILGLSAALSSAGIRAEAGGTAFAKLLIEITNAVDSGGAQLENFAQVAGTTATEFADAFRKNGADALTSFLEGLKRVQDSGGNVFEILERWVCRKSGCATPSWRRRNRSASSGALSIRRAPRSTRTPP